MHIFPAPLPSAVIEGALYEVQKPSRYIGLERNTCRKSWGAASFHVCLAFPETYEIGMSHTGLQVLYHITDHMEGVLVDRAYCPWPDMEDTMRRRGLRLWGLETRMPLSAFDTIGFSLQNELLYTNLLTMLDLSGLPLLSGDRSDSDPLIISGGPCSSNPEPYADFIDAICIGDGEELLQEVVQRVSESKRRGTRRRDMLLDLSSIPGVYVPSLYELQPDRSGRLTRHRPVHEKVPPRVERRFVSELEAGWIPDPPIVPSATLVQERLNIEIARGCTWGCRFCHAGFFQRPLRERNSGDLVKAAEGGVSETGFDELNLLSLSTADYSRLIPLLDDLTNSLTPRHVALSLPSLRVDSMSPQIVARILEVKKTGFTFAPEAGSQRLRNVINKMFTEEDILKAVNNSFEHGWNLVKLYFMIGLPTENEDDITSLVRLIKSIARLPGTSGRGRQINVSVGAFVPKPHTPFQWEPFEGTQSLESKLGRLRNEAWGKRTRVKWQNLEASYLEAALSRGDRYFSRVILEAWKDGARFDSWTEKLDLNRWARAFRKCGVDPDLYAGSWDAESALPWDIIDTGIKKTFLLRERDRALNGQTTADCRSGACQGCGLPGAPADIRLARPEIPSVIGTKCTSPAEGLRLRRNLRIRYSVTGLARFLSHLERGSILKRSLLRHRIDQIYSEGFSPRPRMALGPPLPIGVYSTVEMADFLVGEIRSQDEIRAEIAGGFPPGITVDAVSLEFPECVTEFSRISVISYEFDFSTSAEELWRSCLDAGTRFTHTSRVLVTKEKHGKTREVDLKLAIPLFEKRKGSGRGFLFNLYTNHPEGQNCSPKDVLEELFGLKPSDYSGVRIFRTGYADRNGNRFPLPLLHDS